MSNITLYRAAALQPVFMNWIPIFLTAPATFSMTTNTFGGGVEVYLTRFLKGGATYQDGRLKYYSFLDLELQRSDRIRNQRYYLAIPFFGKHCPWVSPIMSIA